MGRSDPGTFRCSSSPHRHDGDALGREVAPATPCERFDRELVAHPFDEHDPPRGGDFRHLHAYEGRGIYESAAFSPAVFCAVMSHMIPCQQRGCPWDSSNEHGLVADPHDPPVASDHSVLGLP